MFEILKTAKRAVLHWSGGLDSTLILAMLREQPIDFDIVQHRELWTKQQSKKADELIREWNLKVFSYPPRSRSFIGDGENIAVVYDYAAGDTQLLVTKDTIPGKTCGAKLQSYEMQTSPFDWDLHILGTRKDDTHWSIENPKRQKECTVGGITFYYPLFDYTREDVKRELRARGLDDTEATDEEDTGSISLCTSCLRGKRVFCPDLKTMIPPVQWDPLDNLAKFRGIT